MKCLLIIPAYNEAENIEKVVDNIVQNYPEYDYIIVNDGSKDNTAMPETMIMMWLYRLTVTGSMMWAI